MSETMTEQTLDQLIESLRHKTNQVRHLESELKALKNERDSVQLQVLDLLDEYGVKKAGTANATVSISEEIVPNVDPEQWEEVWKWAFEHGYTSLLRRQINSTSYRELLALGEEVPHVTPFTKRKLNLRQN